MSDVLCQKTMPWGNMLLGSSSYYIHARGSFITVLAEILSITPDVVNDKLITIGGFVADSDGQVATVDIAKVHEAFPDLLFTHFASYNNDEVVAKLAEGKSVVVSVDASSLGEPGVTHFVRYIGNGRLHDPWTGTERPTSDFPSVKEFCTFSQITPESESVSESTPIEESPSVTPSVTRGQLVELQVRVNELSQAIEKLLAE